MAKLILATGIDGLDKALQSQLGADDRVESVSFLHALTVIRIASTDTVILSDSIPMSGVTALVDIVDSLRRGGVRVIFLGATKTKDDKLIPALVSRGVYDLLLSDDMTIEDVVDLIRTPATYADVAHWMVGGATVDTTINHRRPSLTLRKQGDALVENVQKNVEPQARPSMRWGKRKELELVQVKMPKKVIVTGLPGSGVSFVSLHIALAYAKTSSVTLVETSHRPVYRSWLNGPVHDHLQIITSSLRSQLGTLSTMDTDIVVIDADLEDVRHLGEHIDVLVVPPDIIKIEYVKDVHPGLVVVNMAPNELPVELQEFGRVWPSVAISSCPFVQDQVLAVVMGRAVEGIGAMAAAWVEVRHKAVSSKSGAILTSSSP